MPTGNTLERAMMRLAKDRGRKATGISRKDTETKDTASGGKNGGSTDSTQKIDADAAIKKNLVELDNTPASPPSENERIIERAIQKNLGQVELLKDRKAVEERPITDITIHNPAVIDEPQKDIFSRLRLFATSAYQKVENSLKNSLPPETGYFVLPPSIPMATNHPQAVKTSSLFSGFSKYVDKVKEAVSSISLHKMPKIKKEAASLENDSDRPTASGSDPFWKNGRNKDTPNPSVSDIFLTDGNLLTEYAAIHADQSPPASKKLRPGYTGRGSSFFNDSETKRGLKSGRFNILKSFGISYAIKAGFRAIGVATGLNALIAGVTGLTMGTLEYRKSRKAQQAMAEEQNYEFKKLFDRDKFRAEFNTQSQGKTLWGKLGVAFSTARDNINFDDDVKKALQKGLKTGTLTGLGVYAGVELADVTVPQDAFAKLSGSLSGVKDVVATVETPAAEAPVQSPAASVENNFSAPAYSLSGEINAKPNAAFDYSQTFAAEPTQENIATDFVTDPIRVAEAEAQELAEAQAREAEALARAEAEALQATIENMSVRERFAYVLEDIDTSGWSDKAQSDFKYAERGQMWAILNLANEATLNGDFELARQLGSIGADNGHNNSIKFMGELPRIGVSVDEKYVALNEARIEKEIASRTCTINSTTAIKPDIRCNDITRILKAGDDFRLVVGDTGDVIQIKTPEDMSVKEVVEGPLYHSMAGQVARTGTPFAGMPQ